MNEEYEKLLQQYVLLQQKYDYQQYLFHITTEEQYEKIIKLLNVIAKELTRQNK